jgi:hypothetical protein
LQAPSPGTHWQASLAMEQSDPNPARLQTVVLVA